MQQGKRMTLEHKPGSTKLIYTQKAGQTEATTPNDVYKPSWQKVAQFTGSGAPRSGMRRE